MRVTATFRPSLLTKYGSWHIITGEWDGSVLWFNTPTPACVRLGVHLSSRTVFEPDDKAAGMNAALAEISAIGQEQEATTPRAPRGRPPKLAVAQ